MRALQHLPTLTALHPCRIAPGAWPLLPQLPLLRRLRLWPSGILTSDCLTLLCTSLSRCSSLKDLVLLYVSFMSDDGFTLSAEQERAAWAALLSSVPNLRRLGVYAEVTHLIPVLPLHLPVLEHLALSGWQRDYPFDEDNFGRVAHPNIRVLELGPVNTRTPSEEEVRSWMGSDRLPKLERYIRRVGFVE
jgi:hypothetical protein